MVKRLVKLLFSFFYFLYLRLISNISQNTDVLFIILYYHSVHNEGKNKFIDQLSFLTKKTNLVSLIKSGELKKGKINVSITFDDGLLSVLKNAQPELIKRKIPFTVFVPSGYLGKVPDWDIDSQEKTVTEPVMTLEQLKQLNKEFCTIGSHTVNHKNLTTISITDARVEIQNSKEDLEKLLNAKTELFSFPYGSYNLRLVELAREIGYKGIYTIDTSFASTKNDEYLFGRIAVSPSDWGIELYLKINGGYNWVGLLQKRRYLKNTSYSVNK